MKEHYPELGDQPLVEPDIIADGETLAPVADESQDFVIASHLLEHCENPILAIRNMTRVLRPGGALILVVPDKRFTFDKDRPTTPLDHFWRDYENGPEGSRHAHYMEWARLVDKHPDDETAERQTAHYVDIGYSIHFHVFTPVNLPALMLAVIDCLPLPASIELFCQNGPEMMCILRKDSL
jgi:SAM-dependent methyltransferase